MLFNYIGAASSVRQNLANQGDEKIIGKRITKSIAYNANGLILRQQIIQTEYEYRGLTQRCAIALTGLTSAAAVRTIYYKKIGTQDDYAAQGVLVGTDVECVASRDGDSISFTVKRTDNEYSAIDNTGWSTTRPAVTGTGVVTSKNTATGYVFDYRYSNESHILYSTETTTVTRYSFRTQAEAVALVAAQTSDNTSYKTWTISSGGASVSRIVINGTRKSAVMRYVDGDSQYTVEVTEKVFSATGNGWS